MKNWREHLRVIALITNILLVLFLLGARGWFLSIGFGIPIVVPPSLAVFALLVRRR